MADVTSVFGGTLIRATDGAWVWSDGTPEPRVTGLSASHHYNFRCRNSGGTTMVEVLLSIAHREKDTLGWVLDGVENGRYPQAASGDHTGPLVMTDDEPSSRMRIDPGEDPLLGSEPIFHERAIPRVALVPIDEWQAWASVAPYGATWDRHEEADILAIARRLGWTG